MKIEFKSIEEVDRQAWNREVSNTSGNPTQFVEYALAQKNKKVKPIFIEIFDNNTVVFQWLIFYIGYRYFGFLNLISEPTSQEAPLLNLALNESIKKFKPFKINFHSITLSRFSYCKFFKKFNFQMVEYGSSIIDLTLTENEIFSKFHSKHRNVIRKAQKEEVIAYENNTDTGVKKFHELSEETYARSNKKGHTLDYLKRHFDSLGASNNGRLFFATKENEIQAAAFILCSPKMAIYWHGASKNHPQTGAANFLHWEIIKKFKKEGILLYDFGGIQLNPPKESKSYSINSFKKRFGGKTYTYCGGYKTINKIKNTIYSKIKN